MHETTLLLIEVGGLLLSMGILGRISRRIGLSPIPLYLLAGLAFGMGAAVLLAGILYVAASRILASDLVRSTLQQQLSTALGQPVSISAASASIYPRVAVDLHSVAIGDPVSVSVEKIRVDRMHVHRLCTRIPFLDLDVCFHQDGGNQRGIKIEA